VAGTVGGRTMTTSQQPPELTLTATRTFDALTFDQHMAVHTALSEQIWREQNLVSIRMTWNLTFQGMLVAIYVFAGSSLDGFASSAVQISLGVCALAVSVATYLSVIAAQNQSDRLKENWVEAFCDPKPKVEDCNVRSGHFPQPFSSKTHSRFGRSASRGICWILGALWFALIVISGVNLWVTGADDGEEPACTVSAKAASPGVVLDCPQLKLETP
jgi:hypothetical protein